MSLLTVAERPSLGQAQGLLVLHHGRGSDEHDLIGLADVLDPRRRLHVAAPRAPLQLTGWHGNHWYLVPRVGHPDHDTFHAARAALAQLHDELWQRTGISPAQTVLGGFSMGSAMSYALGLSAERPAPAGVLIFSGFIPAVDDWQPSIADRQEMRAFIAHGRQDQVISVELARSARDRLALGGIEVSYHESDVAHQIDPTHLPLAADWLAATIPA
ncbi:MAG TPA: phospholipase [Solirubrobacteraceae bacterium]|nr:phospholipase [Solirubrobacteraceae bacterium]